MLASEANHPNDFVSVRTFETTSQENGNSVVFAQRYAADGSEIGSAIQVTSDEASSNAVSVLVLTDGKFLVAYNSIDTSEDFPPFPFTARLATREFNADGTPLVTNELGLNDFNISQTFNATALNDGTYGYLLETNTSFGFGGFQKTQTFGFVDDAGHLRETVLATTGGGDGPFPQLRQSAASINPLSDGRFTVTFTEFYTEGDPNYPPSEPTPTGQQQYVRVYDHDGDLTTSIVIDFDGTKIVERFDPATGSETSSAIFNTDGSRISTQFGITGRSYVEQSITTDPNGAITEQKRYYGDARHTLAFSLKNTPDGKSEVHNYDVSGRETLRQDGNLHAEHDVQQFVYANAIDDTLASSTLTHYGATNTKSSVDVTQADGSHRQRSYADGVTLTSHDAVADTLFGFAKGSDAFAFHANFGRDVVSGFTPGAGTNHDVLQFDQSFGPDFTALSKHFHQVGADTLISFDDGSSVLLKGVSPDSLTPDNVQVLQHDGVLV